MIAAAMGAVFLVAGGGVGGGAGSAKRPPAPTFAGSGPARECVTGHAQFEAKRRTTIRIPVEAAAPISATARATVGRVTVTATLSKRVVEHATATRKLFARQAAIASRRVCVRASTKQAAHTAALNKAYHSSLAAARAAANKAAAQSLAGLVAHVRPATQAAVERMVKARAARAAATAHEALAQEALAKATAKATDRNKQSRTR
ncbi:MAG: hypothetical protein ACTHQQ_21825 [Solirubrobacteraceae bacterium]